MVQKKKIFSCSGNEISPHPKVFFTIDSNKQKESIESCDLNKNIEKKDQSKISCPYCGQSFEV